MEYSVSELKMQLEAAKKHQTYVIEQYEVTKKKHDEAISNVTSSIETVTKLKDMIEKATERTDYKDAVDALKSLRRVIYSTDEWKGPLGYAYRTLCESNGWCSRCSFEVEEPQFKSDCDLHGN